jgi:DNA-directed RNA polymerase sigma subunit (sigma70/sigma32)
MAVLKNYYADDARNIAAIARLKKSRAFELRSAVIYRNGQLKKQKQKELQKQRHIKELQQKVLLRKKKRDARIAQILKWRKYGYNMQGIGDRLGLSRERIRQIVDKDFTNEQQNIFFL